MSNKKPREVYYDIQVTNFESIGTRSQLLKFEETRSIPIIKNTGDYSLSIVRFEIDTYSCPTYFASIVPSPNTDINLMTDSVTLEYNNVKVKQNLEWYPNDNSAKIPTSVPLIGDVVSEYYWGNSFYHYCYMVNIAFDKANDTLKGLGGVNKLPPRLFWNCDTLSAELLLDSSYYDPLLATPASVYFNRSLYSKFSSFPATKYASDDTYEATYKINTSHEVGLKLLLIGTDGINYTKIQQEYSTISNWSAISSIMFTSNTIPIVASQTANPVTFHQGEHVNRNSHATSQSNIITDLATLDLCYKSTLMYSPGAEYRYIDMFGSNPLTNIDIQVYWKDRYGNQYPFYLGSGASFSAKILFKLKE
jgi:hypothetical protein